MKWDLVSYFGLLIGFFFIVQAVTDYPTGVLSDWIGQRWIMFIAGLLLGLSYILFAISTSFFGFLIAYGIFAIAEGQRSGTFQTWFDNNYKLYIPEDTDKQIYVNYQSKAQILYTFVTISSFILGGLFVSIIGRSQALLLQGILLSLYSILFYVQMKDHKNMKQRNENTTVKYSKLFKSGLNAAWQDKSLRWVITGLVLSLGVGALWMNLILYPLYEGYSKTDEMIGLLRAVIFLIGSLFLISGVKIIKYVSNSWNLLALTSFLSDILFFGGIYIMLIWNPIPSVFSIEAFLGVILTFGMLRIPRAFYDLLLPRYFLEAIPDSNRNSIYSLIPSLILIISVVAVTIGGFLINMFGIQTVILLMLINAVFAGLFKARGVLILSNKLKVPIHSEDIISSPNPLQKPSPAKGA